MLSRNCLVLAQNIPPEFDLDSHGNPLAITTGLVVSLEKAETVRGCSGEGKSHRLERN